MPPVAGPGGSWDGDKGPGALSHPLQWVHPEGRRIGTQDTGDWSQRAEIHIKGMISVSPDSCTNLYTGKH